MSNDEPKKTESSIEPLKPSAVATPTEMVEVAELLSKVKEALLLMVVESEEFQKFQARVKWLTRLEASRAEHVLTLSSAVNNQAQARDRQTEAVLLITQKFTEFGDDLKYTRAGVDAIYRAVNNDQKLKKALQNAIARGVREGSRKAIVQGVREASQTFVIHRAADGDGKLGVVARIATLFFNARLVTQVLTFFLAVVALAGFLGYLMYKLHQGSEHAPVAQHEPH